MFHIYGLIIGLAIVIGWQVAEKEYVRLGGKVAFFERSAWLVLILGFIGARAYHVVHMWQYYSVNIIQVLEVWNGGLGIFGGILGGGLGLLLISQHERSKTAHAVALAMPLSQAVGRWANFANNELWGVGHAPLFLYESVLNFVLFSLLWTISHRGQGKGVVSAYLVGYGSIRLLLEPWKIEPWGVGYFAASLCIIIGVFISIRERNSVRA